MKVLAIMGSHKRKRNTEIAMDALLRGARDSGHEVEAFYLLDYQIGICKDCGYCSKVYGKCSIKDDMTLFYEKFKSFDVIVYATPVYFNSVSTLSKIMIDRAQMIFNCMFTFKAPYVDGENRRKGVLISTGGAKAYEQQFVGSESILNLLCKDLNTDLIKHFKIFGTDKSPVEDRVELLEELYDYGQNL